MKRLLIVGLLALVPVACGDTNPAAPKAPAVEWGDPTQEPTVDGGTRNTEPCFNPNCRAYWGDRFPDPPIAPPNRGKV